MPTEREYLEEIRDKTFEKARADGMQIVLPSSKQIQLDIDRPWTLDKTSTTKKSEVSRIVHNKEVKRITIGIKFKDYFSVVKWEAWKSIGGNCHVMLTIDQEMDLQDRICLQSILGSDPMREMLNFQRYMCKAEDPIALFRPPTSIGDN